MMIFLVLLRVACWPRERIMPPLKKHSENNRISVQCKVYQVLSLSEKSLFHYFQICPLPFSILRFAHSKAQRGQRSSQRRSAGWVQIVLESGHVPLIKGKRLFTSNQLSCSRNWLIAHKPFSLPPEHRANIFSRLYCHHRRRTADFWLTDHKWDGQTPHLDMDHETYPCLMLYSLSAAEKREPQRSRGGRILM